MKKVNIIILLGIILTLCLTTLQASGLKFGITGAIKEQTKEVDRKINNLNISENITSPLVASFIFSPSSPTTGQNIIFSNTSSGSPDSWSWNFGDNTTSTLNNPTHIYSSSGSYTVTLIVSNTSGSDTKSRTVPVISITIALTYPIVDTGQTKCYNSGTEITTPAPGQSFYGQDANYYRNTSSYTNNGNETVTDLVTGLMWQKSPDTDGNGTINYSDKMYFDEALAGATSFTLAGYNDWRLPTIKELYSLIMFYGIEPNPNAPSSAGAIPFINTSYFNFGYGDVSAGERIIDVQYATATKYVSTTMNGNDTMFGVNFADGRIKGYPTSRTIGKKYYVLHVRGNAAYGTNRFVDNGNGTITDNATGLVWLKNDNGIGVVWETALNYAEGFEYAGYTDWRLPNAKELHSIVDYTRSPATTGSAAINPVFNCTQITNESGNTDYPYYWTSTNFSPSDGVYISFGRAMGNMPQYGGWIDVHGAGAQRSDPKVGPNNFPNGHGPQGDAIRIYNYVRLVRN